MRVGLGLALALASAAALNWGYLAQHGAAAALPPLSLRRPLVSLRSLFVHRRWLLGFVVGVAGWVLYVGALALAPLSLVQAASAGGIGLLAVLVRRSGTVVVRREAIGAGVAVGGLALLGLSLAAGAHGGHHGSPATVGLWLGCSALAAALVAVRQLGASAGILYAAGDVATKAAVAGGLGLAFVPAGLAAHGLGFVALQLGFQRGGALATAGVATLLTNALPIAAGMAVFGEGLPGGLAGAARVAAFAAVVAGAAALALERPAELVEEPDGARVPDRDERREDDAAGERERPAGEAVQPDDEDLGGEGAVHGAAEEGVGVDARVRVLEAELEDAVVDDGQGQGKREPAAPAVDRAQVARPRPGDPAVEPGGAAELEHGQGDRRRRAPGLEVDRVAEEEAEVAPRVAARRDRLRAGEQPERERDERPAEQRHEQPARRALRRPLDARGGGDARHVLSETCPAGECKPVRYRLD